MQTFTVDEIDKIAVELGSVYGPRIQFAAATGMRPEEWIALERQDIDQAAGVVRVTRTHVEGVTKPYAKTSASLREVPLSSGAMASGARVALRLRGGSASALRSSRTWPRVTRGSQVHSSVLRRNAKMPLPYRGKTTTVKKP